VNELIYLENPGSTPARDLLLVTSSEDTKLNPNAEDGGRPELVSYIKMIRAGKLKQDFRQLIFVSPSCFLSFYAVHC